ncbi:hypothetical protein TWF481_001960 [Arthrobotrys musiformis]|uniref:Uncharacterized protein n=1 Tax=Arthrobotrys musiformis TaxID=47236 RepID=A0AAV9VUU4_9PEZI
MKKGQTGQRGQRQGGNASGTPRGDPSGQRQQQQRPHEQQEQQQQQQQQQQAAEEYHGPDYWDERGFPRYYPKTGPPAPATEPATRPGPATTTSPQTPQRQLISPPPPSEQPLFSHQQPPSSHHQGPQEPQHHQPHHTHQQERQDQSYSAHLHPAHPVHPVHPQSLPDHQHQNQFPHQDQYQVQYQQHQVAGYQHHQVQYQNQLLASQFHQAQHQSRPPVPRVDPIQYQQSHQGQNQQLEHQQDHRNQDQPPVLEAHQAQDQFQTQQAYWNRNQQYLAPASDGYHPEYRQTQIPSVNHPDQAAGYDPSYQQAASVGFNQRHQAAPDPLDLCQPNPSSIPPADQNYYQASFAEGSAADNHAFHSPTHSIDSTLDMAPKKRVSTKDLMVGAGSAAQSQQPVPGQILSPVTGSVPDPQASIAALAEAFPTPFSSRFQEGQLAGPSSTIAATSSSPGPSSSSKSKKNKKKKKGKSKATTPSAPAVLSQVSGNRAGNPVVVSDDEKDDHEKSTPEVAAGVAASSASGPMSQAQLAYLQSKYDDETQKLRATKGKQAVRASGSATVPPAVAPASGPLVADQPVELVAEEVALGTSPSAKLPTSGWEMDKARLGRFNRPDSAADLAFRATYPYYMEGVLEEDPLELGDLQPAPAAAATAAAAATLTPWKPAETKSEDLGLPSAGLVDWDDEWANTFGFRFDEEEPAHRDPVDDIAQWVSDVALESPGKPEALSLDDLGAELDAFWGDVAEVTSQPPCAQASEGGDADGDIEIPDQSPTSPLTQLSHLSTPPDLQEEDRAVEVVDLIFDDENASEPAGSEVMIEVAIPSSNPSATAPNPPLRRSKRGAQGSPEGSSARARSRPRTAQVPAVNTPAPRRRSARISGATLSVQPRSPRESSPAMSATSDGRRGSRTTTSFIHRYLNTRYQGQGQQESEEVDDDEVDMV